jgi:zinc D-Ala-D-Ala carboxypeptidase
MKLSENFTLDELCKSSTAMRLEIDNIPYDEDIITNLKNVARNILQPLREKFNIPFSPNSGYRSPLLNEAIKGSAKSQHCDGQAVDIEIPTIDNSVLAHWIVMNLDFDQLILEYYKKGEPKSGWVHVSYSGSDNRKEVLTYDGKMFQRGLLT